MQGCAELGGTNSEDHLPDNRDEQDWLSEHHPDLVDPRWAKRAEKAARKQASRELRSAPTGFTVPTGGLRIRSIVAIVVVVAGALLVFRHPWTTTSTPAYSANLTTTTKPAPLDLNHPFAKTPAATWADGADGIRLPVAQPIGNFSAAQVATDLDEVKQVVVAAHLDPTMIVAHDPSTYLSLLSPYAQPKARQDFADPLKTGSAVTLLANGFHLLPVPIKVNGTMSVSLDAHGNVAVHANYVFAYPFAPSDPSLITQPWQIDAIIHAAVDYDVVTDNRYLANQRGVYVAGGQGYFDSMACQASKQGYLAPAYSELSSGVPDTESPYAYYDPNHNFDVQSC